MPFTPATFTRNEPPAPIGDTGTADAPAHTEVVPRVSNNRHGAVAVYMVATGGTGATCTDVAGETEAANPVLPEYEATIGWSPAVVKVVEQTALPSATATGPQPVIGAPLSVNATEPPSGFRDTDAVNVVGTHTVGFPDDATEVVVSAVSTC